MKSHASSLVQSCWIRSVSCRIVGHFLRGQGTATRKQRNGVLKYFFVDEVSGLVMQGERQNGAELYKQMFAPNGWTHDFFPAATPQIHDSFHEYARRTNLKDTIIRLLNNGADPESLTFFAMTYCGRFIDYASKLPSDSSLHKSPLHGKEKHDAVAQLHKLAKTIAGYNSTLPLGIKDVDLYKNPQHHRDFHALPSIIKDYADFLQDWPSYLNLQQSNLYFALTNSAFLTHGFLYVSICAGGTTKDLADLYQATYKALGEDSRVTRGVNPDSLERMIREFKTGEPQAYEWFQSNIERYNEARQLGRTGGSGQPNSYVRFSWLHPPNASTSSD